MTGTFPGFVSEFQSAVVLTIGAKTTRSVVGAYRLVAVDVHVFYTVDESADWDHELSGGVVAAGNSRELWFSTARRLTYYIATPQGTPVGARLEKLRLIPNDEIDTEETRAR